MDFGDIGNEFFVIMEGYVKILVPVDEEIILKISKVKQETTDQKNDKNWFMNSINQIKNTDNQLSQSEIEADDYQSSLSNKENIAIVLLSYIILNDSKIAWPAMVSPMP